MAEQIVEVEKWVPDYSQDCEVCGENHVVTGVSKGKVVYQGSMCGVCTWGEADMANPANWNQGV